MLPWFCHPVSALFDSCRNSSYEQPLLLGAVPWIRRLCEHEPRGRQSEWCCKCLCLSLRIFLGHFWGHLTLIFSLLLNGTELLGLCCVWTQVQCLSVAFQSHGQWVKHSNFRTPKWLNTFQDDVSMDSRDVSVQALVWMEPLLCNKENNQDMLHYSPFLILLKMFLCRKLRVCEEALVSQTLKYCNSNGDCWQIWHKMHLLKTQWKRFQAEVFGLSFGAWPSWPVGDVMSVTDLQWHNQVSEPSESAEQRMKCWSYLT